MYELAIDVFLFTVRGCHLGDLLELVHLLNVLADIVTAFLVLILSAHPSINLHLSRA